ncbi:MAG: hypothetical protein FMNOHCHN_02813 [Ignavibacteriaceae bacterium]|nr:hypothetical protein [Ignavibacteriaceae bacterium]
MLVADIIIGFVLLGSLYLEFKDPTAGVDEKDSNTDLVSRMAQFSIRIKTISLIVIGIIYFIMRLYTIW